MEIFHIQTLDLQLVKTELLDPAKPEACAILDQPDSLWITGPDKEWERWHYQNSLNFLKRHSAWGGQIVFLSSGCWRWGCRCWLSWPSNTPQTFIYKALKIWTRLVLFIQNSWDLHWAESHLSKTFPKRLSLRFNIMQVGCLTACLQLLSLDLTLRMSPNEDTQACHTCTTIFCLLFL
jgi:hypothetical protein